MYKSPPSLFRSYRRKWRIVVTWPTGLVKLFRSFFFFSSNLCLFILTVVYTCCTNEEIFRTPWMICRWFWLFTSYKSYKLFMLQLSLVNMKIYDRCLLAFVWKTFFLNVYTVVVFVFANSYTKNLDSLQRLF